MELLSLLNDPPREFTPIPFWFLNGDLTKAELRRQLEDFAAHGVYGVVLHPRMGLTKRIRYLSPRYFSYIRTAVTAAYELGMTVVLYDEGMYPSGSACGKVVEGYPEFASMGITMTTAPQPGDEILAHTPNGTLVVRKSGGTMRGVHFGEDDGEPNAPLTADLLNPAAVQRFICLTHEAYYHELKDYFGSTIAGFFTDEPSILGRNVAHMFPWTMNFAAAFTAAGGDPAGLASLFAGQENSDTKLYHRMILQREEQSYYAQLSQWCEAHHISLMGHPHQSDDIEVETFFHIPGQDLVLRWISPESGALTGMDSTMAKCSADAAFLHDRRRNANECFGACNKGGNPWQLSGGDIKWYLDWLAVRGVNLFIPHAFYYSIAGKRRNERPPDVGPHSIWWPYYSQWALYMHRLACLMTDIDLNAPVAVLCRNRDLCPDLVAPLYEQQIGFHYLPESAWSRCTVQDSQLIYNGHRFQAVLGAQQDIFPDVAHTTEAVTPDCRCSPPASALRTACFTRSGKRCWFLVNEGDLALHTTLTLPTTAPVIAYDLWNGLASQAAGAKRQENTTILPLHLAARQSLLLIACTPAECAALPAKQPALRLPTPHFELEETSPEKAQKTYRAVLNCSGEQAAHPAPLLQVEAEEMAELWVNDSFAGVGFWPPQQFDLIGLLHRGENRLELRVTGSMANLHGGSPVPYGLKDSR